MMIPGELMPAEGEIVLNAGRETLTLEVANSGDRPIQVGSHYHFAETNAALQFDRGAARGMRLNIPAGTAVRFEPGQARTVELVAFAGLRRVYGFNAAVMGPLDRATRGNAARSKATKAGAAGRAAATVAGSKPKAGKAVQPTRRAATKAPTPATKAATAGKKAAAKSPPARKAAPGGKAGTARKTTAAKSAKKGAAR